MRNSLYYDIDGNPMPDVIDWGEYRETVEWRLAHEHLPTGHWVSTVYIGMDHSFGDGPPLIFETMVFGGDDEIQVRYSTKEEALAGHREVVDSLCRVEVWK